MGYRLEISNKYNYGHSTYKCDTLEQLKNILDKRVFDGTLTLYEEKEIEIPFDYSTLNDYRISDSKNRRFAQTELYSSACVSKEYCEKKEK